MAADDEPGPRWSRRQGIFPSHLRVYLECPRRCRLEYVERQPRRPLWQAAMEKGNAVHKIMEACTVRLRHGRSAGINARAIAERCLPRQHYAHPAQREADIEDVLAWSRGAWRYLAGAKATILAAEQRHTWAWARQDPLVFGAKADLVRLRRDAGGDYVEVLDYKTGKGQPYPYLPPLLTRLALSNLLRHRLAHQAQPRVVFTYLWLQSGEIESIEVDRGWLNEHWATVNTHIDALLREEQWPLRPSHLCFFCPYYQTLCHPNLDGA
jgi:PD-(D/E)XK nuclease superfamily protein